MTLKIEPYGHNITQLTRWKSCEFPYKSEEVLEHADDVLKNANEVGETVEAWLRGGLYGFILLQPKKIIHLPIFQNYLK